jgi:acyl-CoA thioesterase
MTLLEQYEKHNGFTRLLGMKLTVLQEGQVEYRLTVNPEHLATPGFLHGGVMTTVLDACMGAGALTLVAKNNQVVSTIEMHVNFLQSAKLGEELVATSKIIRQGKKVIFMQAEIKNESNITIAVANATFYPFAAEKAGYKP